MRSVFAKYRVAPVTDRQLDLFKSLEVSADFKQLAKKFQLVNVVFFIVMPSTSVTLYSLTDLDIACNLLHRKATGFWRRVMRDWLQFAEKKVRILLTTVHRAGMTVALR